MSSGRAAKLTPCTVYNKLCNILSSLTRKASSPKRYSRKSPTSTSPASRRRRFPDYSLRQPRPGPPRCRPAYADDGNGGDDDDDDDDRTDADGFVARYRGQKVVLGLQAI